MKFEICVSQDAMDSITDSIRFLSLVNKDKARKELTSIMNSIHSLDEYPLRHQIVPDLAILDRQIRRFVVSKGRYVILYYVIKNTVFICKFIDSRKDNKIVNDLL